MKRIVRAIYSFSAAILILSPGYALAQCAAVEGATTASQLHARLDKARDCFGSEDDKADPLIQSIYADADKLGDIPFTNEQATDFIRKIGAQFTARVGPSAAPVLQEVGQRIAELTKSGLIIEPSAIAWVPVWAVEGGEEDGSWGALMLVSGDTRFTDRRLSEVFASACEAGYDTPACTSKLAEVSEALRALYGVKGVLGVRNKAATKAFADEVALNDKKWRSYFTDTLPSYPWENWLTSKFYEADYGKAPQLRPPPSYQAIFAHLDVAVEYVGGAPDGDSFKPAILLEVAGWNWLTKWDPTSGKVTRAFAVSAGVLYADRAEVSDAGVALNFRVNNKYSLGVSRHAGNDWGLFLNIRLADKVSEGYEDASKRYKKVRELLH